MFTVMVRGTTSRGTKECRKFTSLVDCAHAMPVISTALIGHYWTLNHGRNGFVGFIHRLPSTE
jgi:hypothetical protein